MVEAKATEAKAKAKATPKKERVPSEHELALEHYTSQNFVLVQWVGSKTVHKLAPSPTGKVREFGAQNYGLIAPAQFLLVHKDDAKDTRFYRRLAAKEKPKKEIVQLHIGGQNGAAVRVTWPGMPKDTLDRFNRLPLE